MNLMYMYYLGKHGVLATGVNFFGFEDIIPLPEKQGETGTINWF